LASCCVIVEPPATMRPFFWFFSSASAMPSQSKPSWSTNFASSAAIYGDAGGRAVDELAVPAPISFYGADKLGGEQHARIAAELFGVPSSGMRFFNVYGPRQDPSSPYSGVISIFTDRLRRGSFGSVTDLIAAIRAYLDNHNQNPQVFVWSAPVDRILTKIAKCKEALDALH